jgi:hypothetical protein
MNIAEATTKLLVVVEPFIRQSSMLLKLAFYMWADTKIVALRAVNNRLINP